MINQQMYEINPDQIIRVISGECMFVCLGEPAHKCVHVPIDY